MEETWNLRHAYLFNGLSPGEMDGIVKFIPVKSFRKGEYIFMAGDDADALHIIQVGAAKVASSI